ncbi:hypothetical protein F5878DRAFT_216178 [Lentinula raphanica]|uniref:Uncharacterized protein n=1 Tax=Lentinula raphanica TaxID=153919 RepID=A0AA38P792_9AGAR|nr:hypothetical protein F5878DRAFT_216178 [Lentinula raphanica]
MYPRTCSFGLETEQDRTAPSPTRMILSRTVGPPALLKEPCLLCWQSSESKFGSTFIFCLLLFFSTVPLVNHLEVTPQLRRIVVARSTRLMQLQEALSEALLSSHLWHWWYSSIESSREGREIECTAVARLSIKSNVNHNVDLTIKAKLFS